MGDKNIVMKVNDFLTPLKIQRAFKGEDGSYYVVGIASDNKIDYYRSRMADSALKDMLDFVKGKRRGTIPGTPVEFDRVKLLPSHNETFAIGHAVDGKIEKNVATGSLELVIIFKVYYEEYPQAKTLYDAINTGDENYQMSIGGFLDIENSDGALDYEEVEATDDEGNTYTYTVVVIKHIILEHVAVTRDGWAANDRANWLSSTSKAILNSVIVKGKDGSNKMYKDLLEELSAKGIMIEHGVVTFKHYPLAPPDTSWSFTATEGNAILDKGGWSLYRLVHTLIRDDENAETKGAYSLPHHKLLDGQVKTYWRGTRAAMAVIFGARGGLKGYSDADIKSGYNHLARHYKEFEKEPPEWEKAITADEFISFHKNQKDIFTEAEEKILKAIFQSADEAALNKNINDLYGIEESAPETKPEATAEAKPETKPEATAEAKPETKPEATAEAKPETKPEATAEAKPGVDMDAKIKDILAKELAPEMEALRKDIAKVSDELKALVEKVKIDFTVEVRTIQKLFDDVKASILANDKNIDEVTARLDEFFGSISKIDKKLASVSRQSVASNGIGNEQGKPGGVWGNTPIPGMENK